MSLPLLLEGAVAVANRDLGPVTPETPLDALGIDSVQLMELIAWAEEKMGVRLSQERLAGIRTIGDLLRALEQT